MTAPAAMDTSTVWERSRPQASPGATGGGACGGGGEGGAEGGDGGSDGGVGGAFGGRLGGAGGGGGWVFSPPPQTQQTSDGSAWIHLYTTQKPADEGSAKNPQESADSGE